MYACFSSCVATLSSLSLWLLRVFQLFEYRQQVLPEPWVVLRHGEMADATHPRELRAGYSRCGRGGLLRRTGVVILPGQQVDRAGSGVYLLLPSAEIPVDAVEVGVAAVDTGAALGVGPPHLPAGSLRALGRHEAVGPRGGAHRAVHVGHHRPVREASLYLAGGLEADHGAPLRGAPAS